MPLSPLTEEEVAATDQSQLRAHQYVIEADEQRILAQRAQLARILAGGREPFEALIKAADARVAAQNALFMYTRPRLAKLYRARLRRYRRLKYLYELEHPPFTHPEFREHPAQIIWRENTAEGWRVENDVPASELTATDDEISPPSFPKPLPKVNDDPPSPDGWGARGGSWGTGGGWGGSGW
ncbi:hypothetical protein R3P38DRAFT_3171212 [Favolaschia claudopus]|uniref:Uncharacterized protein n=1 Tax=Favolaschia claudopus TaxID=2862362 RepID=A0AAW0DQ98_9AGAR